MRLLACLIVAPQRGYDEPATLSYAISSFCPTSADGLQLLHRSEPPSSLRRKLRAKLVTGRFGNREGDMAKLMSKSELIQRIAEQHPNNMTRKDVKGVIESLAKIGYKELKKTGAFFVLGFAKFVVIKKPATQERSGINPFTKDQTIFKAKPARKIIRARPVKAAKDAVS